MQADQLRLHDIRKTSTFRLTVLLGASAMVGVVCLLVLIYGLTAKELNARNDRILRAEATRLLAVPDADLLAQAEAQLGQSASELNYFAIYARTGEFLAGNLGPQTDLPIGRPAERDTLPATRHPLRLLALRTSSGKLLVVGRDIAPLVDLRHRLIKILAFSGLAIGGLIAVAGIASSIGPLRRVVRLQQVARTIAQGNLEARMPISGRGDELDLLAATVNAMIEEVERTVGQIKTATDAAAHDLRTPLTRARNQLYRLSRSGDLAGEPAVHLASAIDELDAVVARFSALLRISELENARRTAGFARVSLAEIARAVGELYQPLAEDRGIAFGIEAKAPARVTGDEKLLFEAVSNLIDNAIKFSPPGGQVELIVSTGANGHRLEVRDRGPGIAADQRARVLRRFDRGAAEPGVAGSGLGLSIVSAILHLHHFVLEMHYATPGLSDGFCIAIVAPCEELE